MIFVYLTNASMDECFFGNIKNPFVCFLTMIWYSHRAENPRYYTQSNVIFINFSEFCFSFLWNSFSTNDFHILCYCQYHSCGKILRIILMIKWFECNNNRVDPFLSTVGVLAAWSSRNPITPSFLRIDITHFELIRITMIS